MPAGPFLTNHQLEQIIAMRAAGKSMRVIANAVGCHRDTIRYHLLPDYRARRLQQYRNRRAKLKAEK